MRETVPLESIASMQYVIAMLRRSKYKPLGCIYMRNCNCQISSPQRPAVKLNSLRRETAFFQQASLNNRRIVNISFYYYYQFRNANIIPLYCHLHEID